MDETKQLQEELSHLRQQLLEAQKMTSLGELVSTTTHEFNNVLMTIINYAKIGLRHRDEPTRDKALQKILAAGERASKITNSVLGMARNRSNRFEPTDLSAMIRESLVLLEREMNKYRVSVELDLEDVPEVLANANQIQQVLLNLIINARQAMPDGGTLWIRLRRSVDEPCVELTLRDSGVGIPEDQLPRIFDSFYTTKRGPDETGRGGTGLGLAACQEIIRAHRGRIRVQSTVGRGTAFTLKLPLTAPKPEAVVSGSAAAANHIAAHRT